MNNYANFTPILNVKQGTDIGLTNNPQLVNMMNNYESVKPQRDAFQKYNDEVYKPACKLYESRSVSLIEKYKGLYNQTGTLDLNAMFIEFKSIQEDMDLADEQKIKKYNEIWNMEYPDSQPKKHIMSQFFDQIRWKFDLNPKLRI